jgi:hypothetical protein
VAKPVVVRFLGDSKHLNRTIDDTQTRMGHLKRAAGGLAGLGIGTALVTGLRTASKAGSDLNETINKAGLAFGKNKNDILSWAQNSAKSMGLPKQAAIEGASTFGLFFSKIGIGTQQSAKMSKQMVQLAVDLGSVHNADPTEIIEAQTSAFRGEYDAIQRFVPSITAATVEQEAMRKSGKKSKDQLTDTDKALAVQAIMLRSTKKESGDFARTQNEAANKTKINKARIADLSANIGTALLPALTAGANALGNMADWMAKNQGKTKLLIGALAALTIGVGAAMVAQKVMTAATIAWSAATKVATVVMKALNLVMKMNTIGIVITVIVLAVAAIVRWYKTSQRARDIINGVFHAIVSAGQALWAALRSSWTSIQTLWSRVSSFVRSAAEKGFLGPVPLIIARWSGIVDWFRKLPGRIAGAMKSLPRLLANQFSGAVKKVLNILGISSPSKVFMGIGHHIVEGLAVGISRRMKSIPNLFGKLASAAGMAFGGFSGANITFRGGPIVDLAKNMAAQMGWVGSQWQALYQLVAHESGWNPSAQNPTSTAYGLFQFLNSTWAGSGFSKSSNPAVQIAAGLNYIKQAYGSPATAWSAWQSRSPHWYGSGMEPTVFSKPTLIGVGESGPETVTVTPRGKSSRGSTITVYAQTNANPYEIAREIDWQQRVSGR